MNRPTRWSSPYHLKTHQKTQKGPIFPARRQLGFYCENVQGYQHAIAPWPGFSGSVSMLFLTWLLNHTALWGVGFKTLKTHGQWGRT